MNASDDADCEVWVFVLFYFVFLKGQNFVTGLSDP